jgi:LysM repeat protein
MWFGRLKQLNWRWAGLLALALALIVPLAFPAPALAQGWPDDDRLSPDPAEYYTVYCTGDLLNVYRADGTYVKGIPLTTILNLSTSGGTANVGLGMSVSRSGDTITLRGSNGNYAGTGAKSFSLTNCVERNGVLLAYYTPAQSGTVPAAGNTTPTTPTYTYYPTTPTYPSYNPYGYTGYPYYTNPYYGSYGTTPSTTYTPPTTTTGSRVHIVQAGENLFRIGLRYGMSYTTIAYANGITDPTHIYAGQRLIIP